ncbi:hypothetical protein FJZ31_39495 [Candidatus Poribacteria bacterium]|nr:hypothetical protein [Candidatus Poribacteria bacterium]
MTIFFLCVIIFKVIGRSHPGPLDSYSINLTIVNNTEKPLRAFVLSGKRHPFEPLIWDNIGAFSGPATLTSVTGEDTEVVVFKFSGFEPGESVSFSGMDPDFPSQPSVMVGEIAGTISLVVAGGLSIAKYEVVGNDVVTFLE